MKIINGKRYNTETAEHICYHGNNLGKSDFNAINMDLYRTPKGAWFVQGWGGAATRYHHQDGGMYSGQESIWPVSNQEAQSIMEDAGAVDALEQYCAVEDA